MLNCLWQRRFLQQAANFYDPAVGAANQKSQAIRLAPAVGAMAYSIPNNNHYNIPAYSKHGRNFMSQIAKG
jgi:hypothetical protein